MTAPLCTIRFPGAAYDPIQVPPHQPLAEVLTVRNSPILFGCRTGLCGTCLVRATGEMGPPDEDEQELLAVLAPDGPTARLACQIDLTGDIAIEEWADP